MAGVVGVFASIGEHLPILKKEKFGEPLPEGEISRFHYRGTVLLILTFCLMVTTTEWVSGTDSIINCLHSGPIPENIIESYCYIMGTFSVPVHYVDDAKDLGNTVSQTGVGPYVPFVDEVEVKAYYQWVPFVLFLQAVLFYVPHIIYKWAEKGKIKLVIVGLQQWVMDNEERQSKEAELATYIVETRGTHRGWCLSTLAAQSLYLINVIGNCFFTNFFLGGQFSEYGLDAASFLEDKPFTRIDPMSKVFPRVTKCTFRKFGPSGTIQRHDAQCILPINIINEKIYVFLWFWFCILSALTVLHLIWSVGIVFAETARRTIIRRKLRTSPRRNDHKVDVNLIVDNLDFGDWKLLYHLLRNMDALVFGEFAEELTSAMRKAIDEENRDDTLSLNSLLKCKAGDDCPRPEDEDEFLRAHGHGNYLANSEAAKAKEAEAAASASAPPPPDSPPSGDKTTEV